MASLRRTQELSDVTPQCFGKSGLFNIHEPEPPKSLQSSKIKLTSRMENTKEEKSRFPKLDECAHFHYEHVEIGPLKVSLIDDDDLKPLSYEADEGKWWSLSVTSHNKTWLIRRSYDNFRMLDLQLHRCIYDRKFSELSELPAERIEEQENIHKLLSDYVERFSEVASNLIICGPVLNWLELDNRGHRLLVPDNDNCPINTPAVAAAYSVKRYIAQAPDEISFEVGDMISVIDMPPPEESIWWRGKRGFQVGFFPCECVAIIGDKVPRNFHFSVKPSHPSKPVLRKHGKLIAFFRSFILSRPSRRKLKQSGILKERVFGCDLGEHLSDSGHEIPVVLKCCVEFIEAHGLIDGIYRLSGITSNIQKLRNAFDEDRVPALYEDEAILQDVHSVASLLKMYFRELPNPLCTYQLYHQFVEAVQNIRGTDMKLFKMRDVVQKLPPPNYRTLEYLMKHLARVSEKGHETGMTSRNVAIVWAPNLLRCKELEVGGVAALQGVGVQAVVTEFLVCYADLIFCDKLPNFDIPNQKETNKKCRPKSLAISTPTKLLSLEEARNRALLQTSGKNDSTYIEVGGGPANLPGKYHTVIELPRKRVGSKRSPLGWKILFGKTGRSSQSRKEAEVKNCASSYLNVFTSKAIVESDLSSSRRHLRPAKSVESLNSSQSKSPSNIDEDFRKPVSLRSSEKNNGHNRSVSHESYFDHDLDAKENMSLGINKIEVNFDLEESEMKIFSEEETLVSAGSGSLKCGKFSPEIFLDYEPEKSNGNSIKRLPLKELGVENKFDWYNSNSQDFNNLDPSPKKQKINEEDPLISKLEERLSSSVGDIQFIDSVSPDQDLEQNNVLTIKSSSISSGSLLSSSLLAPSSPILPHIPYLSKEFLTADLILTSTVPEKIDLEEASTKLHCEQSNDVNSDTFVRNSAKSEVAGSDNESVSVQSSVLTTPETPLCSSYAPLIDLEQSSLSNVTTPEFETNAVNKIASLENLDNVLIRSCVESDDWDNIGDEFVQMEAKIALDTLNTKKYNSTDSIKAKLDEIIIESMTPIDPLHSCTISPILPSSSTTPKPECILETSFDSEENPDLRLRCGYLRISSESSSDSLVNCNSNPGESRSLVEIKSGKCLNVDSLDDPTRFSTQDKFQNLNKNSKGICLTDSEHILMHYNNNGVNNDSVFSKNFVDTEKYFTTSILNKTKEAFPYNNSSKSDCRGISAKLCKESDFYIKPNERSFTNCVKNLETDSTKNILPGINESEKPSSGVPCPSFEVYSNQNDVVTTSGEFSNKNDEVIQKEKRKCQDKNLDHFEFSERTNKRVLETNLDELSEEFLEIREDTLATCSKEKSHIFNVNTVTKPQKSNSCGNVRQLLSRFESKPIGEKILSEFSSELVGSFENEKSNKKVVERPKTLERIAMKRKTGNDSFDRRKFDLEKSKSSSEVSTKKSLPKFDLDLTDPQTRERIEKYKEKRRNYLREKYKSESFKNEKEDLIKFKKDNEIETDMLQSTNESALRKGKERFFSLNTYSGSETFETSDSQNTNRKSFSGDTRKEISEKDLFYKEITGYKCSLERRVNSDSKSKKKSSPERKNISLDFLARGWRQKENDGESLCKTSFEKPIRPELQGPENSCSFSSPDSFGETRDIPTAKQYLSSV